MDASRTPVSLAWWRPPDDLQELPAWRLAARLAADCARLGGVPAAVPDRLLQSRIGRAASEVPANIALALGRAGRGDALHHLSIARGALGELRSQLLVARARGCITEREASLLLRRCRVVGGMVSRLVRSRCPLAGGRQGAGPGPARPARLRSTPSPL